MSRWISQRNKHNPEYVYVKSLESNLELEKLGQSGVGTRGPTLTSHAKFTSSSTGILYPSKGQGDEWDLLR